MISRAPDKKGYWGEFKDNFSYFSTKTYVVTLHWNRLNETVLMMGHKIFFYGEILLINFHHISLYRFYIFMKIISLVWLP